MTYRKLLLTLLLLLTGFSYLSAQTPAPESAISNALESFHRAITENDSTKAANLLAEEVSILEGGRIESREEYLSHHFHSDGKFLNSVSREILDQTITIQENSAWVTTRSRLHGTYSDRTLDLNSLELAVFTRINGTWKIAALHWSSASNK